MVNFYYVMFIVGLFFIAIFIILWDRLANKKSKKSQTKHVRICPKCKSDDVSSDFSRQTFGEQSEFNTHKCNKCGHRSIFFPEIDKNNIKNLNKKSKSTLKIK